MWLVLLYAGFMLIMGSLEAAQSPTHTYKVPRCCWNPCSQHAEVRNTQFWSTPHCIGGSSSRANIDKNFGSREHMHACVVMTQASFCSDAWLCFTGAHMLAQGMFLQALGCISASTAPFLCYMLLLVVRASPWWQPQYFIPMLGIMMGHTISGISVGLAALLNEFSSGKLLSSSSFHVRTVPALTCLLACLPAGS